MYMMFINHMQTQTSFKIFVIHSFVVSMPSGWVFIMFCILLRLTEGVGSAMFATSLYAQLPELFPHSVGTMTVCTYTNSSDIYTHVII